MRFLSKLLAVLSLALTFGAAHAQSVTYTYSNLIWNFTPSVGSPFASCSWMNLDATGDIYNSDNYVIYGSLQCSGGSYAVSGGAYFSGSSFNMTLALGPTYQLVCTNLSGSTLSVTCDVFSNTGVSSGTAFIQF
jgi:hypothetical protein